MLTVTALNLTGGAISDYEVCVWVNEKKISWFMTYGHCRKDGWPALLRLIANRGEEIVKEAEEEWPIQRENL